MRQKLIKTLLPAILRSSSQCPVEQIPRDAATGVGSIPVLSLEEAVLQETQRPCSDGSAFPPEAPESFTRWQGLTSRHGGQGTERPSRSDGTARPPLGTTSAPSISVLTSLALTEKSRAKPLAFPLVSENVPAPSSGTARRRRCERSTKSPTRGVPGGGPAPAPHRPCDTRESEVSLFSHSFLLLFLYSLYLLR